MIVTVASCHRYGLYSCLNADFTLNINADVLNVTLFLLLECQRAKKKTHKVGGDTLMFVLFVDLRKQTDKGVSVVAALHKYAVSSAKLLHKIEFSADNSGSVGSSMTTVTEQQVIVI